MYWKKKKNYKLKIALAGTIFMVIVLTGYYYISKNKGHDTFNSNKFTVKGIDLSHHNPIIDWSEIDDGEIRFVYLKATGGTGHCDRNYKYNYDMAKKNGIRAGAYHFYLFAESGKQQAANFIKNAECRKGDLFPAIDVEHSGDNPYSTDSSYLKMVIDELKILENELFEYYGVHPVIYTNRDCYKLYIKNNFTENLLWICDLHKEPSDIPNWIIWQFSHTGTLPGVVGNLDLNYFRYPVTHLSKILIP